MNGGGQMPVSPQQANPPRALSRRHSAEIRIIEPVAKECRYRYECEGKTAGSICGASSNGKIKTVPEIQVVGYQGEALLLISCLTKDEPYKVHPHNVVGKSCHNGVYRIEIPPDTMRVKIQGLGIQSTKRQDVKQSITKREAIRIDPFKQGYAHKNDVKSMDLNNVRLCFQVFLKDAHEKFSIPLRPVVSDVIRDTKSKPDLTINMLSRCVSPVDNEKLVILLCGKVVKGDVEVHFFQTDDQENRIWEAKVQQPQVHKASAIWFHTPLYGNLNIAEPVKVFIQLYQPSDDSRGEPIEFVFIPSKREDTKRKRAKFDKMRSTFGGICSFDKTDSNMIQKMMHMPLFESPETTSNHRDISSTFAAASLNDNVLPCTSTTSHSWNTQASNVSPNFQHMQGVHLETTHDSNSVKFPLFSSNGAPVPSTSTSPYPGSTYHISPQVQNIPPLREDSSSVNFPLFSNDRVPVSSTIITSPYPGSTYQISPQSQNIPPPPEEFNSNPTNNFPGTEQWSIQPDSIPPVQLPEPINQPLECPKTPMTSGELTDYIINHLPSELLNNLSSQPASEPQPQLLDLDSHQMNTEELQLPTKSLSSMDEPNLNFSSLI